MGDVCAMSVSHQIKLGQSRQVSNVPQQPDIRTFGR